MAINRFASDSPEELAAVKKIAMDAEATAAVECDGFAQGGAGGKTWPRPWSTRPKVTPDNLRLSC